MAAPSMEGSVDRMSLAGKIKPKVNEEDHVNEVFDPGVFPSLAWPGVGVQLLSKLSLSCASFQVIENFAGPLGELA